jgi:hypothetical protein
MKKITWDNPNKMHFESPHKTFNRQTVCITVGNCVAPTQYSSFIRPSTEIVNPVGQTVAEGYLQAFDLNQFSNIIPYAIRQEVKQLTRNEDGILYAFFHWLPDQRVLDGVELTTGVYIHVKTWFTNPTWKAHEAVCEARRYIANGLDE